MLFMGISCISAENIGNNTELSIIDGATDEIISVDNQVEDSLETGECNILSDSTSSKDVESWDELNDALAVNDSVSTVYIKSNLTPGNQIIINHNVTIIGSANTHIGGSNPNNITNYNDLLFLSNSNASSIILKDIKFQNCGGNTLIKFDGNGNYVLENCTFENITASGTKQVIVHLNYGVCDIIDCTFEKCYTDYGAVSNYKPGIETDLVHMVVRGTTFKNNHASTEPGAINNCGQLIVYDSTFENNEAFWWAGAIHTHYNANTTIVRSNFRNNLAGWNGGALYTYSYLTVINSTFIGNNATTNTGGGAIGASTYMSTPHVIIENSEFENNIALTGNGGAIVISSGTLTVENSVFNNNSALKLNGGAISSSNGCTATISNCNFTNNTANITVSKGGAIYATGDGALNVYYSKFITNNANQGNDIAYHYTTKRTNRAFLTYENNEFWGINNASGSIYAYDTHYLIVSESNNSFNNIDQYVVPSEENNTNDNTTNDTNGTGVDVIEIPVGTHRGDVDWSVDLGGALSGTPVISGDYIIIPASHTLYCYTVDGDYVWNVTNEYNCFHEVLVVDDVIFAPCSGDKLYILDLENGSSLTNNNIYQGSSLYAPVMDAYGNVYIASEYGYGANRNLWITVVTYENDDYVYSHSILEINNISNGSPALLSQPVVSDSGYLFINTINGLMICDLSDGSLAMNIIEGAVSNIAVDNYNGIYYVLMNNSGYAGVLFTNSYLSSPNGFYMDNIGEILIIDGYNYNCLYTVTDDGYIYFINNVMYGEDYGCLYGNDDFHVNHVSSAMVAYDGLLYLGDDAGLLWVIDTTCGDSATIDDYLVWAFDTNSSIVGGMLVEDDYVYIGTEDGTFYALTY